MAALPHFQLISSSLKGKKYRIVITFLIPLNISNIQAKHLVILQLQQHTQNEARSFTHIVRRAVTPKFQVLKKLVYNRISLFSHSH